MALAPTAKRHTTPTTRSVVVYVGGRDVTRKVKWDSLVISDNGTSGRGLIQMRVELALAAFPECYDQARIDVADVAVGDQLATGFVISRRPVSEPADYSATEIIAADIGGLLDDRFIAYEVCEAQTTLARIAYLWGAYAGAQLSADLSFVTPFGLVSRRIYEGVTLRQALEHTLAEASAAADYYVDPLGRLRVFHGDDESNFAPYTISGH